MACIKLKKLEEYMQGVDVFDKPKMNLEQYPTPPHIASLMMYNIQTKFGDIENKMVADLGSGTGMLSIGSFLLGASFTVGFEIDSDAIQVFRDNITEMELPIVDCVQCDVLKDLHTNSKWTKCFDTVIMNPPFGTKNNAGIDMKFLEIGINLAKTAVYSLHKKSTRDFIKKHSVELGVVPEVVAELRYNLEASFKVHKKKTVDIEVDFWRFEINK